MTPDLEQLAGIRLSNTRLLIEESRKRIAVYRVLRRHAEARCATARQLLLELRRIGSAPKG